MGFIFRLFFNLILWGIGIILVMSIFKVLFKGSSNSKSRMAKTKAKLQLAVDELKDGLVPAEEEELKTLARKIQSNKVNNSVTAGYFNTLFQEPIIAYALSQDGESSLLVAETADKAYFLDYDGTNAKVFLGNEQIGTINDELQFYISEPKEVKAAIDVTSYPQYDVIKIADVAIAYLNSDSKPNPSSHDRLYGMVSEIESTDQDILISLTLYYTLIKNNIKA